MKLGTLLLGTAAALTLASAAQAADLPTEPTPAAVDYVKVCDTYGAGFFYIPGTETCLDISGRVRAGIATGPAYTTSSASGFTNAFADGRFDFDARSATELGTLRSFFRVSSNADATVSVTKAFISLGYLTTGYAANFFDSFGGLFGDNDRNWGGATSLQVSLLSSDLGGGFYAGFQALSPTAFGTLSTNFDGGTFPDGYASIPDFQAILGIKDQPWGSAAIAAWYSDEGKNDGKDDSFWAVKAAATFKATNELSIAGQTYYQDIQNGNSTWEIGLGASYAASDALTINVNGEYKFVDIPTPGDADTWGATLGADYTIVKGLVATAEVSYDDGKIAPREISGLFRLTREW